MSKESTGNKLRNIKDFIVNSINNPQEVFVSRVLLCMIVFLILCLGIYFYYMYNLASRECRIMDGLYSTLNNRITNLNFDSDEDCNYCLRDYYINTAFNCCSGGSYKNDYVGTSCCVLKNIIKQGVRCLDFEIYSIDNVPVVATSTLDDNNIKETYNSIPFTEVMSTVVSYAFSSSTAPNYTDPIILHFRIKSTNQQMYSNLAAILKSNNSRLLGPAYSFEYNLCDENNCYSRNLGDVKLKDLKNKIIIIVDRINTSFIDNKDFYEFVNMTSNSMFMRCLRYYDVQFTPDMNEMTLFNKKNMTIVLPDNGASPDNPSGIVCREMGCQMVGFRYQLFDNYLQEDILFFDKIGYGFVLKPEKLRYIPVIIKETPPNDPLLSFETRTLQKDYYKFDI